MKKVEISADALKIILQFISSKPGFHHPATVRGALLEVVEVLKEVPDENAPFDVGYRVKPKPGRNYLRAGQKAYDEAMIVSANPFIIVSLDGEHVWEGMETNLFDVYNRLPVKQHSQLALFAKGLLEKE